MLNKLHQDMINAMKSGSKQELATIRIVKAQIDLDKISKKRELTDDEVIAIIAKQIKMRKESVVEFTKANRLDLADKTNEEIKILEVYLPTQLSAQEINQVLDNVFASVNPKGTSDLGLIMKEVMPLLKGKADMAIVNDLIKTRLNSLN